MSPPATGRHEVLTEAGFARLAKDRLWPLDGAPGAAVPQVFHQGPSDFDLNPDLAAKIATLPAARASAVLVPVVARQPLTMLLTTRAGSLARHAGQIAFPGGTTDPGDASPVATALREAYEEIGLIPGAVTPLGLVDRYRTGTGYLITPVVALLRPPFDLAPNPAEVADIFEVPLGFLMDPDNHMRHARTFDGIERFFHAMPFGERYIWGATAGIIKALQKRLFPA